MAPLESIRIAGYRSIRDQAIELSPLTVLIGANGSGKSNFLSAFELLRATAEDRLRLHVARHGGADRLLHFGRKRTDRIEIGLRFAGAKPLSCVFVPTSRDDLIADWRVQRQGVRGVAPADANDSRARVHEEIREPSSAPPYELGDSVGSWRHYHLRDTSPGAALKQKQPIDDNRVLRADGANLAPLLYRLQMRHPDTLREIVEVVQLTAPFFQDLALEPDRLNERLIQLEWRHRGSDSYFDAHALSDGTLRFLALSTLLLQPQPPSILLLDEPELSLHPHAITLLVELLRAASREHQVIVATQSTTLVDQLVPEEVLVVDRDEHASLFRRLDADHLGDWLDEYRLGELWQKNLLDGRPGGAPVR